MCVCPHTHSPYQFAFNIPAVLPELLILTERNGTQVSRTSAEQGNLSVILVFIYIMYTKKAAYNKISELGVAVVVFKGLAIPR